MGNKSCSWYAKVSSSDTPAPWVKEPPTNIISFKVLSLGFPEDLLESFSIVNLFIFALSEEVIRYLPSFEIQPSLELNLNMLSWFLISLFHGLKPAILNKDSRINIEIKKN